jgi:peptide/nickel transport system permease protein
MSAPLPRRLGPAFPPDAADPVPERGNRSNGFLAFVAKRLGAALLAYVCCIMAIAALLNGLLAATIDAQIAETVNAEVAVMMRRGSLKAPPSELKAAMKAGMRSAYGLDKPFAVQVLHRTWDIVSLGIGSAGKGGRSADFGRKVGVALLNSFILLGISTIVALGIGIRLGCRMASRPGGRLDRFSTATAMLLFGTPTWWIATLLLWILVLEYRVFPFGMAQSVPPPEGFLPRLLDRASYLVLPVLSIVFIRIWGVAYMARAIVLPPLQDDYIMAARGRGISERKVLHGHALGAAMPGIATSSIQLVVASLGGDILVEKVFAYPGIGYLFWESLRLNRIPLAIASLAMLTAMSCLAYAGLDIAYSFLDPRIRRPARRQA